MLVVGLVLYILVLEVDIDDVPIDDVDKQVDGELFGFREAVVSRSIRPDCISTEPCLQSPCVDDAQCVDDGLDNFRCVCDHSDCYRPVPPTPSIEEQFPLDELVRVQDLVVREGSRSPLTTANIAVAFSPRDEVEDGDDGIMFRVVVPPDRGELLLTRAGEGRPHYGAAVSFSLADIKEGRVVYDHDGSEATSDSFGLELELPSTGTGIQPSDGDQRTYAFSVVVQVAAWNDRPLISLPTNDTLNVIAGTQVRVGRNILNVSDSDDVSGSLEITVQYQPGDDYGYFELADALGVRARVTRFTLADIDAGRVKFVHRGTAMQQLRLQVSSSQIPRLSMIQV